MPLDLLTSTRGKRLLGYVPGFYETSRVLQGAFQAEGGELDAVKTAIDEILDQFFVRTASWKLDRWEAELGLVSNPALSDADRQDRIVSKLRGYGTATIAVVKSVVESYGYGKVDVWEDTPAYAVTVKFVDTRGQPATLEDLKGAVRNVVPAHLGVTYEFSYLTWSELDAAAITWNDLDDRAFTWAEFEAWRPAAQPVARSSVSLTGAEP